MGFHKVGQGLAVHVFHDDAGAYFGILAPTNAPYNMLIAIKLFQNLVFALQTNKILRRGTLLRIQGFQEQFPLPTEHCVQNTITRSMIWQLPIIMELGKTFCNFPERSRSETIFHLWPIIDAKVKKSPLI